MHYSDFLVVGSGIAGLTYALEMAEHGMVTVLCKAEPTEGNTQYAQGGIASVTSEVDSFEAHVRDTLEAGAGLCHEEVVELVVRAGPNAIDYLVSIGTKFDHVGDSQEFELGREGGHTQRRILHFEDRTGAEIQRSLLDRAKTHPNISILSKHVAIDLIRETNSENRDEILGVYSLELSSGNVLAFAARATMLSTGGAGKVYLYTSNPDVSTGDGIAMAYRAGCEIVNMEFFQFHPTCLYHPQAKSLLITEAMRGEGARLLTPQGHAFMAKYDARAELAPRDIVARAIDEEMKAHGYDYVLLDISFRGAEFVRNRFPTLTEMTRRYGFELTSQPIPVVPAAHYCCGGVRSDAHGRAGLARLYVAGETAFTGLHGANRLASNSLLEALVFAKRAAEATLSDLPVLTKPNRVREWDYLDTQKSSEEILVSYNWDEVRRLMWHLVGISRSEKRLNLAKRRLEMIRSEVSEYYWRYVVTSDLVELRNIIDVAQIIVSSASARRESRGLHYNVDFPLRDDTHWKRDSIVSKAFQ